MNRHTKKQIAGALSVVVAAFILLSCTAPAVGMKGPLFADVGDAGSNAWEKIKEAAVAVWDFLCTLFPIIWDWIKGVAGDIWLSIKTGFGALWTGLVDFPVRRAFVPVLRQSAAAGLFFGIVLFSVPANPRKRSPGGPIFMFFVSACAGTIAGLVGAWLGLVPVVLDFEQPTIHNLGALPVIFERLELTSSAASTPVANYFIFPLVLLVFVMLLAAGTAGGGALVGRIAGAWLRRRVVKTGSPPEPPVSQAIGAGALFAGILGIMMLAGGLTLLAIHYESSFWAWITIAFVDLIALLVTPAILLGPLD